MHFLIYLWHMCDPTQLGTANFLFLKAASALPFLVMGPKANTKELFFIGHHYKIKWFFKIL